MTMRAQALYAVVVLPALPSPFPALAHLERPTSHLSMCHCCLYLPLLGGASLRMPVGVAQAGRGVWGLSPAEELSQSSASACGLTIGAPPPRRR